MEIRRSEEKLQEQISRINKQLQVLNAKMDRSTGEIVGNVSAKSNVNAKLSLSYAVSRAGWAPFYDIRATDAKSPVKMVHKANVVQETGEEIYLYGKIP